MKKSKIHEMIVEVQQEHLDENDHVNNVQYLQWVQDVAKAHWEKEAEPQWLEQFAWVALNHFIAYKKPAFVGDQLILKTYIDHFNGVKSNRKVEITNKATGIIICQCQTEWCMLDKKTGRPARITAEMEMSFEMD